METFISNYIIYFIASIFILYGVFRYLLISRLRQIYDFTCGLDSNLAQRSIEAEVKSRVNKLRELSFDELASQKSEIIPLVISDRSGEMRIVVERKDHNVINIYVEAWLLYFNSINTPRYSLIESYKINSDGVHTRLSNKELRAYS